MKWPPVQEPKLRFVVSFPSKTPPARTAFPVRTEPHLRRYVSSEIFEAKGQEGTTFGLLFETAAPKSLCSLPFTGQVHFGSMRSFDITPQIHRLGVGAVDFVSRLCKCLDDVSSRWWGDLGERDVDGGVSIGARDWMVVELKNGYFDIERRLDQRCHPPSAPTRVRCSCTDTEPKRLEALLGSSRSANER